MRIENVTDKITLYNCDCMEYMKDIPDNYFEGNFTDRFKAIFGKLATDFNNNTIENYMCANGINKLFSDKTWRKDLCKEYLLGLNFIRDNNAF